MNRFKTTVALVFMLLIAATALPAQESEKAQKMRGLNNKLLAIHAQLQESGKGSAGSLRSQAAPILAERAATLNALNAENPAEALKLAFSQDLLDNLKASFPQSAGQLESQGVWEATVEHFVFDDPSMTVRRTRLNMLLGNENVELHFAPGAEPDIHCHAIVRVAGVRSGNRLAGAGGQVTGSDVAAAGCSTTGTQNVAVLLVTFPGITPSVAPQTVYDIFFSPTGRSVDGYWKEASYGKAAATGNVFGWYTLPQTYTCDQYSQMRSAAIAAADADVFFPNYTRVFIVFPDPGGCGWAGLGTMGCGTLSSADGSFTASSAWQLAAYMGSRDHGVKLSTHEGGHNITLHHSSSRDFGAEALGPVGSAGTLSEYGDVFSTMGSWNLGHYPAPHKVQLSWLSGSSVQTVESNGTYTLQPIEVSPAGLQALKVRRGTGNDAWLWIEYRQPLGLYDSAIGSQVFSGALIHYQDSTTGTHTHLLDFTPETSSWSDPALTAGKSWTDPYSNVTISIGSATPSGLGVTVTFGPVPCVEANPTVALSPANPTGQAGANVNYTVTVTNNNSSGCSAGTFLMGSTLPGGWVSSFNSSALSINSGQSLTTTMTKTVPMGTLPGTYGVNANAANGSFTGSGSANVTVVAPPSVVVSVGSATYAPRATVSMSAAVTSGGSPAAGASVTFTMTRPNGKTTSKTVTAGSNGVATWNYRLGPKDPKGSYSVSAVATYNSLSSTSNTATFSVQ